MKLRRYRKEDCGELYELYYNTVHSVNLKDYSQEQVEAWATKDADVEVWGKSFLEHYSIVATQDNNIIGFGDIDDTGYLDRLYVHKDYQGIGVATMILNDLEKYVRDKNIKVINIHASITLKPVLQKRGYVVVKEQSVERNGQILTNFHMVKNLCSKG
ncbi:MAG: GNAT family N-acetyltransferase [Oscillospiraceae bacterium]|nr:GNAT family N-acetyltransferase [Oscillospiraceae bacterium]